MKETRTVNLNGLVYNIDLDAYHSLRDYLQDIELRLPVDQKHDVMTDVEARIGELFQRVLFAKNCNVVNMDIVNAVMEQIGKPSEFGENKRPKPKKMSGNRGIRRVIKIAFVVLLIIAGMPVLFPLMAVIFGCLAAGVAFLAGGTGLLIAAPFVGTKMLGVDAWLGVSILICALAVVVIPLVMVITSVIAHVRSHRGPKKRFWWTTVVLWIASLFLLCYGGSKVLNELGGIDSVKQMIAHEDGQKILQDVTYTPFTGINVSDAMDVKIIKGEQYDVSVYSCGEDVVTVEVRDSVLYLSRGDNKYDDADIAITTPDLQTLCVNGASDINMEGSFENIRISLSGSSDLDAENATIDTLHINCSGASEADVCVMKQLWAQASGASNITYRGEPVINQSMAVGASEITKK